MIARLWPALAILAIVSTTAYAQDNGEICKVPLDITIILDASGSISNDNWKLIVGFTNNLIGNVKIGPDSIRMSLIMFSSSFTIISNLNEHNSNSALLAKFHATDRKSGGTNTHLAITAAKDRVFAANPRNVKKIAILLTDGRSNSMSSTARAASQLQAVQDMHVFAVGIGSYKESEINAIASNPDEFYNSTLATFNLLHILVELLGPRFCQLGLGVVTKQHCSTDADCSNIANSICKLGLCSCLSQRLQYENGSCLPRTGGGAYCNTAADCALFHGAVCDDMSGLCICQSGLTCQECKLGSPCDQYLTCKDAIKGWVCNGGRQECSVSRVQEGDYFCRVRVVGERCSTDAECRDLNGTCTAGKCQCAHEALIYNKDDSQCRPRKIGESCLRDSQCAFINNAKCTSNKCQCSAPFISKSGDICGQCNSPDLEYNPTTRRCSSKGLGASCTARSDCKHISNAVCVGRKCACALKYGRVGNEQRCGYCGLGTYCPATINCTYIIHYSTCSGNTLICQSNAIKVDAECKLKVIGSTCAKHSDCSDKKSGALPYRCVNGFCRCADGYREDDKNLGCEKIAIGSDCKNDMDCKSLPGTMCSGTCRCRPGFKKYPFAKGCAGPCEFAKPCQNGGSCSHTPSGDVLCRCPSPYTGDRCQTLPDRCHSVNCNFGHCNPQNGQCVCSPGYTGPSCNIPTDKCLGIKCFNGGRCLSVGGSFQCSCVGGWTGNFCTIAPHPCVNNVPCLNGGVCQKINGKLYCVCTKYFRGLYCEHPLKQPCSPNPCANRGHCIQHYGGGFVCKCPSGYSGTYCKIRPSPCDSKPCKNRGWCETQYSPPVGGLSTPSPNIIGYRCHCPGRYLGNNCEHRVDACKSSPCQNGGKCAPGNLAIKKVYVCHCLFGYRGDRCENDTAFLSIVIVFGGLAIIILGILLWRCMHCYHRCRDRRSDVVMVVPPCKPVSAIPARCTTSTICYPKNMSSAPFNSKWNKPMLTYY